MSELLDEYQENKIQTEGDDGRLELLAAWTSIIMHQIMDTPDDMEVTKELIEPWGLTLIHALQISGFEPEDIKPVADKIMQYLKEDYNEQTVSNLLDQLDDEPEPFDNVTEILKVLDQFATAPDVDELLEALKVHFANPTLTKTWVINTVKENKVLNELLYTNPTFNPEENNAA
tara:strand:+ start:106 stop:627 length:522 start_codon:yes stop_codon:yes gene_type:complete